MSLWDAIPVPSRVIGMMHTATLLQLHSSVPITRDALEKWMAPGRSPEQEANSLFRPLFSECRQLGLLVDTDEGNGLAVPLAFSAAFAGHRRADVAGVNGLNTVTELVRRHVWNYLAQTPVPDPNFCRLMAWMLMQNGNDLLLTFRQAERLSAQQDPGRNCLGFNDVRYGAMRFWVVFLGFGWQHALNNAEVLQPDPTMAFEHALSCWAQEDENLAMTRVPLGEFLSYIAQFYPWVENGEIARAVREQLVDAPVVADGQVNDTTAIALSRLQKKGIINLHRLSDASVWTLGWGGPRREVSHVEWKGKKSAK